MATVEGIMRDTLSSNYNLQSMWSMKYIKQTFSSRQTFSCYTIYLIGRGEQVCCHINLRLMAKKKKDKLTSKQPVT